MIATAEAGLSRGVEQTQYVHTTRENDFSSPTHDLAGRPHMVAVGAINRALSEYMAYHEDAIRNDRYPEDVTEQAASLRDGISSLQRGFEDAIQPGGELHENHLTLTNKIAEADEESQGGAPSERMAHRLSKFSDGIVIVTDFDGTMTKLQPIPDMGGTQDHESYLAGIPGSDIGETLLKLKGREAFPEAFAMAWKTPLEITPDLFRQLGQRIPLRAGLGRFLAARDDLHIKSTTVLSANFEDIILGGLDQLGEAADGINVIAVRPDDVRSTEKGLILSIMALQHPDQAIIYFGDGASDDKAIEAAGYIAGVYSLTGAGFTRQLERANYASNPDHRVTIPYDEYTNFHDITDKLRLANARAKILREQAAA